ncbi:OmpA family protein [Sorangium cellulosum]|uniref:OmpA family protein n=1 Tax=Sorangium cellulosum TaxID=56 RepID=UPI0009D6E81C|nr:OmpA family protein [Sorangium cellulosum]
MPIANPALTTPLLPARRRPDAALAALLALAAPIAPAAAQPAGPASATVGHLALQQLEPAPAGDALFGVASPSTSGHLVPHVLVMFDYARNPLQLRGASSEAIVSSQAFARLDVSLSLLNRLLISLDMPVAVLQEGHDPGMPGVAFHPPSGAALGDLRAGLRVRLLGDEGAPLQAALGAYVFAPTGAAAEYDGEGAFRVAPHATVGGKLGASVPVVWSVNVGTMLRGSDNPHTLTFGGGAAVALLGERLRVGPEIYGAVPLADRPMLSAGSIAVTPSARVNAEVLLGVRVRLFDSIELGGAGGPGLSRAIGTPTFRLLALASWSPAAPRAPVAERPADRDGDGILDGVDACPAARGVGSADRTANGCPKADRDGDGVLDVADACPTTHGPMSLDLTKNGCPPDRDGDTIADAVDACPDTRGTRSADPEQNGCPPDRDGDGVLDLVDACPLLKGPKSADRSTSGCPDDIDGDGLKPPEDACPRERGKRDPDPAKSGCPDFVRVASNEIVLLQPIRFQMYGRARKDLADPITDAVLLDVKHVIEQHPEFKKIEVQGHADDLGDPEFNATIAQERADEVLLWLTEIGVPRDKLVARGYGDSVPLATNRTDEGRKKNRRIQLFVIERE